jgi:hypothetical protein
MLRTLASWPDVLEAAESGVQLWYQAPMDYRPYPVRVIGVSKGKIRLGAPLSQDVDPWTADAAHLGRFRVR